MTLSSSPVNQSGTPTAGCTFAEADALVSRSAQIPAVGIGLLETNAVIAAEQELDDAIQHLRTLSALAEDRGDIETAKELSRRMLAAIHSRSPEHIARLEQEAWNELQDSIDYFQAQGERDRAALLDVSAQAVRRRMGDQ